MQDPFRPFVDQRRPIDGRIPVGVRKHFRMSPPPHPTCAFVLWLPRAPAARLGYSGEPCATLTPCSSIGRLSLAEWIGLTACVRGDSWSATSGAEQPAGKSNDSRPFRLRTQGAMPRCAHTSSTRSNSRGLHSRARGRRISARGYIASAPAWYARALDFSRITAHILSQRRDIARYIRIFNPSRSRSTSSHRSARCHRRRPIRCDGIQWTTSVCGGRVTFAHR